MISGDKSRMILNELGNVAGLYDVSGQSGYPRNVVNLDQTVDAPRNDDTRMLVESALEEALIEHRRWNPVVNL